MPQKNKVKHEVTQANNLARTVDREGIALPMAIALILISLSHYDIAKIDINHGGQIPRQTQPLLIADKDQGDDPHGPDPHDEIHDKGLPSNQARDERKPTDDVYGGHELDEAKKRDYNKDRDRFAADPRYGS
ncbi:MAG: hypothetical protein KGS72_03210 [Cyanobacteria bacterium REEB67]|nr:hypothetical protein [Cyanobacteria bacterium REEB67]